jgi:hypothetical protein
MRTKPHPEQGFRFCLGILRMEDLWGAAAGRMPPRDLHWRSELSVDRLYPQDRPRQGRSFQTPPPTPIPSSTATSVAAATTTDQQEEDLMLSNYTHERLAALGLAGMAKAFDDQQRQPDVTAPTFEQRLGLMIDREATERENKRLIVRLQFASLRQTAILEDAICARRAASIAPSLPSSSMAIGSAASKICSSPGRLASAK